MVSSLSGVAESGSGVWTFSEGLQGSTEGFSEEGRCDHICILEHALAVLCEMDVFVVKRKSQFWDKELNNGAP